MSLVVKRSWDCFSVNLIFFNVHNLLHDYRSLVQINALYIELPATLRPPKKRSKLHIGLLVIVVVVALLAGYPDQRFSSVNIKNLLAKALVYL